MRCVLVGGVGFLGAVLTGVLLSRGFEVIVVSKRFSITGRRAFIAEFIEKQGASIRVFDDIDEDSLSSIESDVFFHVAGRISGSLEEFRDAHVSLLDKVVTAASRLGARVVYVSSIGAVGEVKNAKPGSVIYEEEELQSGERVHRSHYEATKMEGEKLLASRSRELKGKWSIVRPGLLLGPWAYHSEWRLYLRALRARLAPRLGFELPLVHVRDVAEILADAGEGRYDSMWLHAVSPFYPDFSDLVLEGCRILNKKCLSIPLSPISKLGVRLLYHLAPRGSPLALTASLLRLRYRYASRHLRREWRSVSDMVSEFLQWAREWPSLT